MKKLTFLIMIILTIMLSFTGCGNKNTPPPTNPNTTPAPATVNTLDMTPEVFHDRWNRTADIAQFSTVKMKEIPGTGGTDKTTYTFSKNNTVTVFVHKEQKKVDHLVLKSNIYKVDETESETLGSLYYLVFSTVEPNLSQQEMNAGLDELMNAWEEGNDKTITKGNTTFSQKVGLTGNLELIVKHKND